MPYGSRDVNDVIGISGLPGEGAVVRHYKGERNI